MGINVQIQIKYYTNTRTHKHIQFTKTMKSMSNVSVLLLFCCCCFVSHLVKCTGVQTSNCVCESSFLVMNFCLKNVCVCAAFFYIHFLHTLCAVEKPVRLKSFRFLLLFLWSFSRITQSEMMAKKAHIHPKTTKRKDTRRINTHTHTKIERSRER